MTQTTKIFLHNIEKPDSHTLQGYLKDGGYKALRKALTTMKPDDVIQEVLSANLRGRGGAGFPTGRKWSFVPKGDNKPHYLCINADEGEPGTFKDRILLEKKPHLLLEGIIIACYAVRAQTAYIYIRGELVKAASILEAAIEEARAKGFVGQRVMGTEVSVDVFVHRGAGAYVCGEETSLIESLEGKRGWPRVRPPFPAVEGLFRCPTVVNNVETIAAVPAVIERGGKWYASLGTTTDGGTKLFCVSGHVKRPGVYELPMGTSLKELLFDHCGGMLNDRPLKAVIPGGSSTPPLTPDEIDVPLDFDSLKKVGSMLGSGAVIVMDESTCLVRALARLIKFYAHESCGQCTPCRHGTYWMEQILERVEEGHGRPGDLDLLLNVADSIMGRTICPLGDAAAMPVQGFLAKFRDEFEQHIALGRCPLKGS